MGAEINNCFLTSMSPEGGRRPKPCLGRWVEPSGATGKSSLGDQRLVDGSWPLPLPHLEVEDPRIVFSESLIVGYDSEKQVLVQGKTSDGCEKPAVPCRQTRGTGQRRGLYLQARKRPNPRAAPHLCRAGFKWCSLSYFQIRPHRGVDLGGGPTAVPWQCNRLSGVTHTFLSGFPEGCWQFLHLLHKLTSFLGLSGDSHDWGVIHNTCGKSALPCIYKVSPSPLLTPAETEHLSHHPSAKTVRNVPPLAAALEPVCRGR